MAERAKRSGKAESADVDPAYFTREQLAKLLAVTVVQFDRHYSKLAPDDGVLRKGSRVWFHGRKLLDAWLAHELAKVKPKLDDETELMVGDGDSPWLEAWRKEKALIAKMDREERDGTHVNLQDLERRLMGFASMVRRGGEVLQRRWGNDASDVLNEAVDAAIDQLGAKATTGDDAGDDVPQN